jgi:hypothetical protein
MSSTATTITMLNGVNYAYWATEMAVLQETKQVYGIITGYDDLLVEPAANTTATGKDAVKD